MAKISVTIELSRTSGDYSAINAYVVDGGKRGYNLLRGLPKILHEKDAQFASIKTLKRTNKMLTEIDVKWVAKGKGIAL